MMNKKSLFLIPIFCTSFLIGCSKGGDPDPTPTSTTYNFLYYDGHSVNVEVPEGKDVKNYYPENTPKHDDGYKEYTYTWEERQTYSYQEIQTESKISIDYIFEFYDGHSVTVEVPKGKDVKDYYPENTPKHDDGYTEYTYTWEYKQNYKYQEKQNSVDISTTYYFEYVDITIPTKTVKVPRGGDVEDYYPAEHSPDYCEYNDDSGVRKTYVGWILKEGTTYKETSIDTNIYKVTYHLQDGATHENEEWLDEVTSYTLKPAECNGYTFKGWFDNATGGSKVTILNLTSPIELWARFEIITYNITYLPTGVEHSNQTTYTVKDEINLSPASKNGYTFTGWTDNKGKQVTKIKSGTTGAITLTANFTIIKYTITYHNTDGKTFGNPTEYYVTTNTFTLNAASKTGYDFGGWFNNEGCTGNPINQIEKGTTGNLDLYAKLPAHEYNITYHPNGGTNPGDNPTTYTIESTKTLSNATKDESVFGGWYKESTFTTKVTSLNGLHEDLDLYAKFTDNSYSIEYIGDFTGATNPNVTSYTYYEKVELVAATKNDYDFGGWFIDEERKISTSGWNAQTHTGKQTIYSGGFIPHPYKITYVLDGGTNSEDNPETYTIETPSFKLLDATKDGHSFNGWYDSEGKKVTYIIKGTTGEITLYARYNPKAYIGHFDANGGEFLSSKYVYLDYCIDGLETVKIDVTDGKFSLYENPAIPDVGKKTFVGWYYDKEYENLVKANDSIGCGATLFAKWISGYPLDIFEDMSFGSSMYVPAYLQNGSLSFSGTFTVKRSGFSPTVTLYVENKTKGQKQEIAKVSTSSEKTVDISGTFTGDIGDEVRFSTEISTTCSTGVHIASVDYAIKDDRCLLNSGLYDCNVYYNSQVVVPTPTYSGYTFDGWYDEEGNLYTPGIWKFTEDKTFTAHWK